MDYDAVALEPRAPSNAQLHTFAALTLVYVAITIAVIPFAHEPGPADPHIAVAYGSGILMADLCTALLLGTLYRATGRAPLLILTCAYFYGALMAALHMAAFPGALPSQVAFHSAQAVGWLYIAWRLGMALLFLAAVLRAGRPELPAAARKKARRGMRLLAACLLTLAVAALIAAFVNEMPAGSIVGERFTDASLALQWAAIALLSVSFVLIWWKRGFDDVLYLWIGLVLIASIADLTLSAVAGARFTIGWHAARASFVVSACLLLAFLLGDLANAGRRLSRTSLAAAYGGAVAVTLAASFLRWFLDPWLGVSIPFVTLYGAVAIAVWFGGVGPAALAMTLGYIVANVRYITPVEHFAVHGPTDAISLVLFAVSCSLIIVLGEAMRRARDRYRASELELTERARELGEANASKSQFLAMLSHELRNPLAPLRTGLALLRLKPSPDPAVTETHRMMERQIAQLARLIDDLLDLSRIDRGKMEMRTDRVALADALRAGVDTARPNIAAKGHSLDVRYPAAPLYVDGDPVRLAQVVSNLLNNAAKFTPPNGRIELAAWPVDGSVVVRVGDNGIGIPADKLNEVFGMFVQLDAAHVAAGGLGLGLTLARSIVERHRGRIEARSGGAGQGSEFLVTLPLAAPPKPAAANEDTAPAPERRRVLVVDDNVDAAQTLAEYLRLEGHRVESALDGESALRIAEMLHPEVAFIDLNMPGMDGAEVARRLRKTPWGRHTRLVALTGMGQLADIARTRAAGFDEHITKPAELSRVSRLAAA
ncbi:MAG TPA: ATP-binding protein [Burkholderiales bacterium]|nr:ATP-binding protein [Burkholderiales bacterium]